MEHPSEKVVVHTTPAAPRAIIARPALSATAQTSQIAGGQGNTPATSVGSAPPARAVTTMTSADPKTAVEGHYLDLQIAGSTADANAVLPLNLVEICFGFEVIMHGRPRKAAKAEELVASAAKAEKLRQLQSLVLDNHRRRIYTKEALEICAKLLELNPEVYTAWNYRKHAVKSSLESCVDQELVQSILSQELTVAELALRRNPKCYGAWHHRKWILKLGCKEADFNQEFRLLDLLLKADSRNFHGWNHRRFVAALGSVPQEEELDFTTEKIHTNFSNYSAWHNRCAILSNLMGQKVSGFSPKEKVLTEELELIHQALFTDPDDQSGWFYHFWLLDQIRAQDSLFLISTWPAQSSEVVLTFKTSLEDTQSSDDVQDNTISLPIVLYFSKAAKNVDSTTVSVNSVFTESDCLDWKALSTDINAEANCWVAYLKISERNSQSLEAYPVKVIFNPSQGLLSLDGCPLVEASSYEFSIKIDPDRARHSHKKTGADVFSWDHDYFLGFSAAQTCSLKAPNLQPKVKDHCDWRSEILSGEILLVQELISEINCKIGKLTLARLFVDQYHILSGIGYTNLKIQYEEALHIYDELMQLDPLHVGYYKDQRSLVLMEQMTLDESIEKHLWLSKESSFTSADWSICLRLNNISLTRIGSVERLLWVTMLDLSHNELQSISGLEAMQHLSHLNLSHNNLSSMSALEPLKSNISLRVLNISYNEIGAHSIDTKRCLRSSSALPQQTGSYGINQGFNEYDDKEIKLHWDTIQIFKNMHLVQFDVVGNPILTESFKTLMIKLIPSLQWFDHQPVLRY
ncbi:RAB geranylgeranyl transferase alpha subunit 1 [Wolffia australiana]